MLFSDSAFMLRQLNIFDHKKDVFVSWRGFMILDILSFMYLKLPYQFVHFMQENHIQFASTFIP